MRGRCIAVAYSLYSEFPYSKVYSHTVPAVVFWAILVRGGTPQHTPYPAKGPVLPRGPGRSPGRKFWPIQRIFRQKTLPRRRTAPRSKARRRDLHNSSWQAAPQTSLKNLEGPRSWRRAQRRRATLAGGELRPDLRPVPALCGTSLLRSARARGPDGGCTADSGGDDDAGAPAASRPPLGGRICSWWRSTARAEEPSPEATRVTCSCRIRCWALWLCK